MSLDGEGYLWPLWHAGNLFDTRSLIHEDPSIHKLSQEPATVPNNKRASKNRANRKSALPAKRKSSVSSKNENSKAKSRKSKKDDFELVLEFSLQEKKSWRLVTNSSQNSFWLVPTGHDPDVKEAPSFEFVSISLLSRPAKSLKKRTLSMGPSFASMNGGSQATIRYKGKKKIAWHWANPISDYTPLIIFRLPCVHFLTTQTSAEDCGGSREVEGAITRGGPGTVVEICALLEKRISRESVVFARHFLRREQKDWTLVTSQPISGNDLGVEFVETKDKFESVYVYRPRKQLALELDLAFPFAKHTLHINEIVQTADEEDKSGDLPSRLRVKFSRPGTLDDLWKKTAGAVEDSVATVLRGNRNSAVLNGKIMKRSGRFAEAEFKISPHDSLKKKAWIARGFDVRLGSTTTDETKSKFAMRHWRSTKGQELLLESTVDGIESDNGSTALDAGTLFGVSLNKVVPTKKSKSIDGSFEFEFASSLPEKADLRPCLLRMMLQDAKTGSPLHIWDLISWEKVNGQRTSLRRKCAVSYIIEDLRIPVLTIKPAVTDRFFEDQYLSNSGAEALGEGVGYRSDSPIIIPTSDRKGQSKSKTGQFPPSYYLKINESVNAFQSLRTDYEIERIPGSQAQDSANLLNFFVIDSQPQIVASVKTPFLASQSVDTDSSILARRTVLSEERGGWELLNDSALADGFSLSLPAQSIGEQVVKAKEFPENQIADSRFSAPAILNVAPERLDRRYVAVPWDLRRIWGKAGESAPGAPLLKAKFELLYGMEAELEDEQVFIAELGAKLGEFPPPSDGSLEWTATSLQSEKFEEFWEHYRDAFQLWKTRIAILEPWNSDPFSGFSTERGIQYRARVAPPLEEGLPPIGAQLKWPFDRGTTPPSTDREKSLHTQVVAKKEDQHKDGLEGGFHFGFESYPVYKELVEEWDQSSSGSIENLAFSSVGGWGKQTARFSENKTIIQSTTTMGRTHVYAVERIGRIGVFWNKAKHVILYERQTVPSKQFFGTQDNHLGRPLLRKIKEYIEILEPERSFPDFGEASREAAGFIEQISFRTKIFPVLSSWGNNVYQVVENGKEPELAGWEIPLWNPGADLDIYPFPQIQLGITPPRDSGLERLYVECSAPEQLYFYTDIRSEVGGVKITDDVHAWPPVSEVDYTNQPDPRLLRIAPAYGRNDEGLDRELPSTPSIYPGFERFTFPVIESHIPGELTTGHFDESQFTGVLKTVAMMRSSMLRSIPGTEIDWDDSSQNPYWIGAGLSGNSLAARKLVGDLLVARTDDKGKRNENLKTVFEKVLNGISKVDLENISYDGLLDSYGKQLKAAIPDDLRKRIGQFSNPQKPLTKHLAASSLWPKPSTYSSELEYAITKSLWREAILAAESAITRYENLVNAFSDELIRAINRIARKADAKVKDVNEEFDQRLDKLKQLWTGFQVGLDQVVALVRKSRNKLFEQIRRVSNRIDNFLDRVSYLGRDQSIQYVDDAIAFLQKLGQIFDGNVLTYFFRGAPKDLEQLKKDHQDLIILLGSKRDKLKKELNQAEFFKILEEIQAEKNKHIDALTEKLTTFSEKQIGKIREFERKLVDLSGIELFDKKFNSADLGYKSISEWQAKIVAKINVEKKKATSTLAKEIGESILYRSDMTITQPRVFDLLLEIERLAKALLTELAQDFLGVFGDVSLPDVNLKKYLETFQAAKDLKDAIESGDSDAIFSAAAGLASEFNEDFAKGIGQIATAAHQAKVVEKNIDQVAQVGSTTLRNYRSTWDQFTAPGLGFNRKTVSMLVRTDWKDVREKLSLTPLISQVNETIANGEQLLDQANDVLNACGIRLPTVGISDQLLPATQEYFKELGDSFLEKFEFSDLMKDIGGIRLTKLFRGFKMPGWAHDKVKITHGFDKSKLSAWVKAESDIKFNDDKKMIQLSVLTLVLRNGHFTAVARIETDIEGRQQKITRGRITGDLIMSISGQEFTKFKEVAIIFENDELDFEMDPNKVECPGLLTLLSDVTQNLSAESEGFKVGILKEHEFPVGVRADLDVGPFDVGGGVASITGLIVGGFLELRALTSDLKFDFKLGAGFNLGKQDRPFNITICILGGGGYFNSNFLYRPASDELTIGLTLSVHASATFNFSQGWISGGVGLYLGFEGSFQKSPSTQTAFSLSLYVAFIGHCDVLGLIYVYLQLRLELTYEKIGSATEFRGVGRVKLKIRICKFIKINVDRKFKKVIAKSGRQQKKKRISLNGSNAKPDAGTRQFVSHFFDPKNK